MILERPKARNLPTLIVIILLFLLSACRNGNGSDVNGAVWLDDPIMTSGINEDMEPIDERDTFPLSTTRVYCFERIKGPEKVVLGVKWYKDEKLIAKNPIEFDKGRKSYAVLARGDGKPLGPGNYRCEIYATSKPLRTISFTIK